MSVGGAREGCRPALGVLHREEEGKAELRQTEGAAGGGGKAGEAFTVELNEYKDIRDHVSQRGGSSDGVKDMRRTHGAEA